MSEQPTMFIDRLAPYQPRGGRDIDRIADLLGIGPAQPEHDVIIYGAAGTAYSVYDMINALVTLVRTATVEPREASDDR